MTLQYQSSLFLKNMFLKLKSVWNSHWILWCVIPILVTCYQTSALLQCLRFLHSVVSSSASVWGNTRTAGSACIRGRWDCSGSVWTPAPGTGRPCWGSAPSDRTGSRDHRCPGAGARGRGACCPSGAGWWSRRGWRCPTLLPTRPDQRKKMISTIHNTRGNQYKACDIMCKEMSFLNPKTG